MKDAPLSLEKDVASNPLLEVRKHDRVRPQTLCVASAQCFVGHSLAYDSGLQGQIFSAEGRMLQDFC